MSARLKVAHIIQAYHPHVGGAEMQLRALAPRLKALGVETAILTRRYAGMAAFERVDGVPVYRLPVPGSKATASLAFTLTALWRLLRLRPDMIHAHELLSPTTTALAGRQLLGVPVVAKVLRGGLLGDIDKLNSRGSGQQRIEWMKERVDAFIVISREIDRELAEMGVPDHKRIFIPNGVDVERFKPPSPEQKAAARAALGLSDDPLAVYAGRFVAEKRIEDPVEIWPQVRRIHPRAGLLLVGDGPETARLHARSGEGVRFAGRVEDVRPYLQAADGFVLPSATEGLSNSLLEALAMGLPCVATAVGGASDLIENGRNGRLVTAGAVDELRDAIIDLFSANERRTKMGELARRKVLQDYSLERAAQRFSDLYTRLTSARLLDPAAYR